MQGQWRWGKLISVWHIISTQTFGMPGDEMGFVVGRDSVYQRDANQGSDAHQNCIQLKELIIQELQSSVNFVSGHFQ